MDPCNPEINVNNARLALRRNMGVPKAYAKNFSRKAICDAFKKCKGSNVFPPMEMKIVDGYVYLIDSNSPLTAKEYRKLFETGKKEDTVAIAKKLGVVELDRPKNELMKDIQSILSNMDILEPIKAMKVEKKKELEFATNNNGNKNLFNNNSNKNKNLFNNGNGNKNLFASNNNGNKNKNLFNNGNGNRKPGRPIVKAPGARINANNNGSVNNLRNFVKTPKVRGPGSNKKNVNVTNIMKTLEGIKNEIGVLPPGPGNTRSLAPTRTAMSMRSATPSVMSTVSTAVPGAYTKNNLNRRSVEQLRRIGTREFAIPTTLVRQPGYTKDRLVRNILNKQSRKLESIVENKM